MKRTYAVDKLAKMKPDGKFICSDGEVPFIWGMVCQVGAFKNLSEDITTDEKIIPCCGKTVDVIESIVDWIQFDKNPDEEYIDETIDIYMASDEYEIEDLRDHLKNVLMNWAKDRDTCISIYEQAKCPTLKDVKDIAYKTIRNNIVGHGAFQFTCDKFDDNFIVSCKNRYCMQPMAPAAFYFSKYTRCPLCKFGISLEFITKCPHTHKGKINKCNGKIIIKRHSLSIADLSDDLALELLERIHSDAEC